MGQVVVGVGRWWFFTRGPRFGHGQGSPHLFGGSLSWWYVGHIVVGTDHLRFSWGNCRTARDWKVVKPYMALKVDTLSFRCCEQSLEKMWLEKNRNVENSSLCFFNVNQKCRCQYFVQTCWLRRSSVRKDRIPVLRVYIFSWGSVSLLVCILSCIWRSGKASLAFDIIIPVLLFHFQMTVTRIASSWLIV